jgi:hypothetical protein
MMAAELSGRDIGRRIFAGIRAYVARATNPIHARFDEFQRALDSRPTFEMMRVEVGDLLSRFEFPTAEQKPAITIEEFWPRLEAAFAKWELDFDRRADAKFERAIDRLRQPADGEDGKDGGSVEDFDIAIDGRNLTVTMKIGERVEQRTGRIDVPLYRGVYQSGKQYEKGDIVTFGGSWFIAARDTTEKEKPEASAAWVLCVKRGRDGKDGNGTE